jgi:Putative Ig domain
VTNPGSQTSAANTAVSLQIQASATPPSLTIDYAAAGLPPGLSIGVGTGLISGTPSTPGTFTVTVTAIVGGVSGSATFTWTIQGHTVTVTSPGNQAAVAGAASSLQIQASVSPSGALDYTATGLPGGLFINPSTGLISGTALQAGTSTVTVTAQDITGASGSATFTWTIQPDTVTVTSPGLQTTSGAVNLQIHASDLAGQPLTYTATGLPPGLSINAGTGLISGTAIPLGTYTVTVTASAGSVSGSTTFTWTINLL